MSLIRVRRDRKKSWIDTKKGFSLKALAFLLILVIAAAWFLTAQFEIRDGTVPGSEDRPHAELYSLRLELHSLRRELHSLHPDPMAPSNAPVILILAGEPSGDLHAARVARALRERWPDCRLVGTGGERMRGEGVELLAGLDDLAVMGFVEVAARLPFFWKLERRVRKLLDNGAVDLVIPVDYPGFNLRMTERAHEAGIPVVYYIAPQVWAWKAGRTARLAKAADRIAVILPFEERIFRAEGADAVFVGHPLLDRDPELPDRAHFCEAHGLDPQREILALFPGSREQEIERHLEPFMAAGRRLGESRRGLQIAVAKAESLRFHLPPGAEATLVPDGRGLLRHARAAIVKSGTTTLEAALEGTPFVVAYRTHPWTYWLARRLVKVDHVALANLVAEDRVVPELLQDAVRAEPLARAVGPLLDDSPQRSRVLEGLRRIRDRLGAPGAATRVAELAGEVLSSRKARLGGTGRAQ